MASLSGTPTTSPEVIYRYQPMRPDAIDFIRKGRLWFSSPSRFNDPFDFLPDFTKEATKIVDQHREEAYWNDAAIRGSRRAFFSETEALRNQRIREVCNKVRSKFLKDLAKNFWVACFSEDPDNILMWSHYASYHTGLCVGIRPERMRLSPEMALRWKVTYDDARLPIEHSDGNAIALRKAKVWDYEKEWRIVMATGDLTPGQRPLPRTHGRYRSEPGSFLQLQWGAFESVRFGALVDPKKRSKLLEALRSTERSHIKIVQMHLAASRFALESECLSGGNASSL
jgi:hypothetical protein